MLPVTEVAASIAIPLQIRNRRLCRFKDKNVASKHDDGCLPYLEFSATKRGRCEMIGNGAIAGIGASRMKRNSSSLPSPLKLTKR